MTRKKDIQPEQTPLPQLIKSLLALRNMLLHYRAVLPRPGYHTDLTPEVATDSVEQLQEMVQVADFLSKQITDSFKGAEWSTVIDTLDVFRNNPSRLFEKDSLILIKSLEGPVNLLEKVRLKQKSIPQNGDNI